MPEAGAVNSGSAGAVNVSPRLEKAITELQGLQELLLSGDGLDSRILTDFREALNRIRNTAWSANNISRSKPLTKIQPMCCPSWPENVYALPTSFAKLYK